MYLDIVFIFNDRVRYHAQDDSTDDPKQHGDVECSPRPHINFIYNSGIALLQYVVTYCLLPRKFRMSAATSTGPPPLPISSVRLKNANAVPLVSGKHTSYKHDIRECTK